jgi:Right handed beta helix region
MPMFAPMMWILATTLSVRPAPGADLPRQIDVDCRSAHNLDLALAGAKKLGQVDIYLHGVCEGHFVISSDGVALRGATPDSGLAAPPGDVTGLPVLEVADAQAILQGIVVRGGALGVIVDGWNAEVEFVDVDVHDQVQVGVVASRGAFVGLIDTTVHDGGFGVVAQSNGEINLQYGAMRHLRVGVAVDGRSFGALNYTTITDCTQAGLVVDHRSDANVIGCVFHDNGGVHIQTGEWSSTTLLSQTALGSASDTTPYAIGVYDHGKVASFSTPEIFGNVSLLINASIQFGNTVLHGDLIAQQFADAFVRNAEITGIVLCFEGADAICSGVTTGGVYQCASSTCGSAAAAPAVGATPVAGAPVIQVPRIELPGRLRSGI